MGPLEHCTFEDTEVVDALPTFQVGRFYECLDCWSRIDIVMIPLV